MRTLVKARGDISALPRLKRRRELLPGKIHELQQEILKLDVEITQLEGLKKFRESSLDAFKITDAGFTFHATNSLLGEGITTMEALTSWSEKSLRRKVPGLGNVSIKNIKDVIGKMGLQLRSV